MARLFALLVLASLAFAAQAHTGIGATAGFGAGFFHPLAGADHVLAMVAVGLLGVQLGGRALWALPLAFIATMLVAGGIGLLGPALPIVEFGIIGSIIVLGALIAFNARLPLIVSVLIVAVFAFFHGHAHGAEMPATAGALGYGAGFALATALLHGVGICAGLLAQRLQPVWIRAGGGVIAAAGLLIGFAG